MTNALLALLVVTVGLLIWRAVTRDRRDYARFKRLRSTVLRQRVFRRWIAESWLVLGGLSAALLFAAWPLVPTTLDRIRETGFLAWLPWGAPTLLWIVVGIIVAMIGGMIVPVLLLRGQVDEIPTLGDIRALLPRNRDELPHGTGLAITAGIVEELLFRLALPAVIFGITGNALLAFGAAAVLFGLLHIYQGAHGMAFAFVLGLVFTALYVVSGTILVPIVLHALIDLRSLVLIPVVLGGAWDPPPPVPARTARG